MSAQLLAAARAALNYIADEGDVNPTGKSCAAAENRRTPTENTMIRSIILARWILAILNGDTAAVRMYESMPLGEPEF